jgi:hypothetical protein
MRTLCNTSPTSQRDLATDAADANNAAPAGNTTASAHCSCTACSIGITSTAAALAAAHKPPSAEVNGRIEPARAPWFANASATDAERDFSATASAAMDTKYSQMAT